MVRELILRGRTGRKAVCCKPRVTDWKSFLVFLCLGIWQKSSVQKYDAFTYQIASLSVPFFLKEPIEFPENCSNTGYSPQLEAMQLNEIDNLGNFVFAPGRAEGRLHVIHRVEGGKIYLKNFRIWGSMDGIHLILVLVFSVEQHLLKPLAPFDLVGKVRRSRLGWWHHHHCHHHHHHHHQHHHLWCF